MTLVPTKRHIKITAAGFTPISGSAIPIIGVTGVSRNPNAQIQKASGDGDLFATSAAVVMNEPTISFEVNITDQLASVAPGTEGTVTWTDNDARNGAAVGGGGQVWTATHAIYNPGATTSSNVNYKTGSESFELYSGDGTTNPLSIAAA